MSDAAAKEKARRAVRYFDSWLGWVKATERQSVPFENVRRGGLVLDVFHDAVIELAQEAEAFDQSAAMHDFTQFFRHQAGFFRRDFLEPSKALLSKEALNVQTKPSLLLYKLPSLFMPWLVGKIERKSGLEAPASIANAVQLYFLELGKLHQTACFSRDPSFSFVRFARGKGSKGPLHCMQLAQNIRVSQAPWESLGDQLRNASVSLLAQDMGVSLTARDNPLFLRSMLLGRVGSVADRYPQEFFSWRLSRLLEDAGKGLSAEEEEALGPQNGTALRKWLALRVEAYGQIVERALGSDGVDAFHVKALKQVETELMEHFHPLSDGQKLTCEERARFENRAYCQLSTRQEFSMKAGPR